MGLLRCFPENAPEPVETLIPAHPDLIHLAVSALNEIAHIVWEREQENSSEDEFGTNGEGDGEQPTLSTFMPIASTGELGRQIVDGEEILSEYANVAEWAIENKPIWQIFPKTPAHLAQMLVDDKALFDVLRKEYEDAVNQISNTQGNSSAAIPLGFPSEYDKYLPTKKTSFARKQANKKAYHLVCLLYGSASEEEKKQKVKQIHTIAKSRNCLQANSFIAHQGWERIYHWLCDRIAEVPRLKGIEDL